MRVLMTTDAIGGVWGYALELARALGDRAEILLATMGPAPSADQLAELASVRNRAPRRRKDQRPRPERRPSERPAARAPRVAQEATR